MISRRSKEMADKIIVELDEKMQFFERVMSPEYFGCEFLHDKKFYQKDIKDKLYAYLDHIIYGIFVVNEQ